MQSLGTKSSRPRPKSFETETRPSRPRRDLRDRDSKQRVSRPVSRPRPRLDQDPSLVEYHSVHAPMAWSQKFRLTPDPSVVTSACCCAWPNRKLFWLEAMMSVSNGAKHPNKWILWSTARSSCRVKNWPYGCRQYRWCCRMTDIRQGNSV